MLWWLIAIIAVPIVAATLFGIIWAIKFIIYKVYDDIFDGES